MKDAELVEKVARIIDPEAFKGTLMRPCAVANDKARAIIPLIQTERVKELEDALGKVASMCRGQLTIINSVLRTSDQGSEPHDR